MSFFVTGTDTNVGKTVVSALLCTHFQAAYFKPIQTGCLEDSDVSTVQTLSPCTHVYPNIYQFKAPLSPHAAACLEGRVINPQALTLPLCKTPLIVEGAGGLLVPVASSSLSVEAPNDLQMRHESQGALAPNHHAKIFARDYASHKKETAERTKPFFMIDLVDCYQLPVILVARASLGTVNHTLLSLEALYARGIPVAGVVLTQSAQDTHKTSQANAHAIESFSAHGVRILDIIPWFHSLSKETIASHTLSDTLKNLIHS